jgi:20S proteasome alpha/beta subunit
MFSITKQLNYGKLCSKLPNMTFILGARCMDGVVLVGDTRFTIDDGIDWIYDYKILAIMMEF